jgi:histidinol-phosphate aminotransferase
VSEATPRSGVRDVDPYVSPQFDVQARLNTNEAPHPLPEGFARDLAEAVTALPLNRYPDGQMTKLRERLARRCGHRVEGTWVANGSNEILAQLLLAYGGPGRRALLFEPTYLLHSRIAWLTGTDRVERRLDEPWTVGSRDLAAAIDARPEVVFLCSPNNPTGNTHPLETVDALAAGTDALVIVDEAYIEFGGRSALPLLERHANLAVVRTFSKAFALAGARIGYVLTSPGVVGDLQRVRLPYHVSTLTQAAGIAALDHETEAMGILDPVAHERDRIVETLGGMPGVRVFPSEANFVLFVPARPAANVWRALLDRGVLVRDLSGVVPNALRVTAGAPHEIDLFLKALEEVLAE